MSRQQRRALQRQQAKQALRQPATGPRTEVGKAVASQNALSHGLTAARLVLPWENEAEFNALLDGLLAEHRPASTTESILVREMAEQYWRLLRARNHEFALLSVPLELSASSPAEREKALLLASRYITRHERAFHKCLSTLRSLQKERRAAAQEQPTPVPAPSPDVQFVSQNAAPPSAAPATTSEPEPLAGSFAYLAAPLAADLS